MARDTDRKKISEAVRLNRSLWYIASSGIDYVTLETAYDERIYVRYGTVGQVTRAVYSHWEHLTGVIVSKEEITRSKRQRVLELINQKDVTSI